jgi:hypothetical protein
MIRPTVTKLVARMNVGLIMVVVILGGIGYQQVISRKVDGLHQIWVHRHWISAAPQSATPADGFSHAAQDHRRKQPPRSPVQSLEELETY